MLPSSTKSSIDNLPSRSEPEPSLLFPYGIGIDTHRDFIQVRVLRQAGQEVVGDEREFDTTWAGLLNAATFARSILQTEEPLRYCIESTGTYHCPVLLAWGGHPSVVNPVLASPSRRKTDVLDARLLARQSITGMWPASYLPTPPFRELRVCRALERSVRRTAATLRNRLNGWALRFGFTFGRDVGPKTAKHRAYLQDLAAGRTLSGPAHPPWPLPVVVQPVFLAVLEHLEFLDRQRVAARRLTATAVAAVEIVDECGEVYRGPDVLEMLTTVPGVGRETALDWLSEVCDVRRFEHVNQCVAFCGSDPSQKVSAGKVTSHTRRKGNAELARALRLAGGAALRGDTLLGRWGRSLRNRHKKGGYRKAVGAVARRIVIGLYHVQRTCKPWDESKYRLPAHYDVPCERLEILDLPPRAVLLLEAAGIRDTTEVADALVDGRLVRLTGIGAKCLERVKAWIQQNQLHAPRTTSATVCSSAAESSTVPAATCPPKMGKGTGASLRTTSRRASRSSPLTTGKPGKVPRSPCTKKSRGRSQSGRSSSAGKPATR